MKMRLSELRCRELVNVCDGARLGYLCDLELELPEGRICAMYVPGPPRFFGLFGRDGAYRIPWNAIKKLGADVILVDVDAPGCRVEGGCRKKRRERE